MADGAVLTRAGKPSTPFPRAVLVAVAASGICTSNKPALQNAKKPRPCGSGLGAWASLAADQPAASCLLGCGSASGGRSCGVSGSLGCVSCRRCRSGIGSRRCGCIGGHGSGSFGGSRRRGSRSLDGSWCRCWSGFFLLATSGEGSSSDQGGQNERVLHFRFSYVDRQNLEKPRRQALKPRNALAQGVRLAPLRRSRKLYWHLVNTD